MHNWNLSRLSGFWDMNRKSDLSILPAQRPNQDFLLLLQRQVQNFFRLFCWFREGWKKMKMSRYLSREDWSKPSLIACIYKFAIKIVQCMYVPPWEISTCGFYLTHRQETDIWCDGNWGNISNEKYSNVSLQLFLKL